MKSLPKKEREPVIMAILAYALDGESTELSGVGSAIFSLVKPTLDTGRKKAEVGKQGGSKTKANQKQSESKPEAKAKQTASEKEREKEGEKEKEKEIENESYIPPKPPKGDMTPLEIAMDDFAKARKAMKKPLTDKARELTLSELEKLAPGNDAKKIAILNQSIQRGWQGVFPLKSDQGKTGPKIKTPYDGIRSNANPDDGDYLMKILGGKP